MSLANFSFKEEVGKFRAFMLDTPMKSDELAVFYVNRAVKSFKWKDRFRRKGERLSLFDHLNFSLFLYFTSLIFVLAVK